MKKSKQISYFDERKYKTGSYPSWDEFRYFGDRNQTINLIQWMNPWSWIMFSSVITS